MKILYCSDLHGNYAALECLPEADMVLVGGDFTTFGSPEEFREAVGLFARRFPKFHAVAGNLDPGKTADQILQECGHLLSLSPMRVEGVTLMGVGGSHQCPRPTPYEWNDQETETRLAAVQVSQVDILVTHAPPFGFGADVISNGVHVGSHAIQRLAARLTPVLHLCGHIHEAAGVFDENGTVLVNPGAFGEEGHYALIDWKPAEAPSVQLH
ncbi:MAG: metallophosphoesterase family protein [Victivallales bacterium]|nr:metallophosphoesterase family protein [Victivallales bacterium]